MPIVHIFSNSLIPRAVHVEAVLTESDFDPDVFTNDAETPRRGAGAGGRDTPGFGFPSQRSPSAFSELSLEGAAVLKRDTNWDFADTDRPPIYTVDVHGHNDPRKSM